MGTPYTIDTLIGNNGDWVLTFARNRHGDNYLFILPNYQVFATDGDQNQALIDMCDGSDEAYLIIEHFILDNPTNPFISHGATLLEAITETNRKLALIDDAAALSNHIVVWLPFIMICYMLSDADDVAMYLAGTMSWPELRHSFDSKLSDMGYSY